MKRVAFFGASVTQQKSGYCRYFADYNTNFLVGNFGYGGMHLSDAGVAHIDDVISFDPEYCFIDWFNTDDIKNGRFREIKEYLNTIICKLFDKRIKIIFLIFPDSNFLGKDEILKEITTYIDNFKIPIINLSNSFSDLELSKILRDAVHTTEYGSDRYAREITDMFMEKYFCRYEIPTVYPQKNEYYYMKKLALNLEVQERIFFQGNCKVVGIEQSVGPYTGMIRVNGNTINNWDRWCYYERDMISTSFNVDSLAVIEVMQDEFNRSACAHPCVWSKKKILKTKTIYYIGESLELVSYS